MGFEVYVKGSAPVSTVPSVTIQKRGLMSLNRAAHELLGSPNAVELLWDESRRVIGLRSAELTNPNAYPMRPQASKTQKGPFLVAATLFTQYIGLDTTQAKRWVPKMEDEILCIDLNTPGQRVSSPRGRKAAAETAETQTSQGAPT
ncbi:hypothetical protein CGZ98_07390 [Enemella evansiae]|nr:hypothetical protein CGZ95_09005 [Enemella evansiae]OYO12006.1 hypothetical protein CGZ98_07390 [Enemella evansiae]